MNRLDDTGVRTTCGAVFWASDSCPNGH